MVSGFFLFEIQKCGGSPQFKLSGVCSAFFLDNIITFRALDEEDFTRIAAIMMCDLVRAMGDRDITLVYSEEVLRVIAHASYSRKYGARNMRRYIQTHVEDAIANAIISGYRDGITTVTLYAEQNENGEMTLGVHV